MSPSGPLRGSLRPPGDKSISHRAALLAAMGEGEARVENYLDSADTRATLAAIAALGARPVEVAASQTGIGLRIGGAGLRGAAEAAIDAGNAGTLLRVLPGWLAGQGRGRWTLDGDESLRRRPVDRISEPLRLMGGLVECREGRLPPLTVEGANLRGIEYRLPVASAQVKSCVLLAGLLAEGETAVIEAAPSRDHTERMLRAAGAEVEVEGPAESEEPAPPPRRVTVRPAERLEPGRIVVPGDFSSAAFWLVAAALVPGSELRLEGVGVNPTRTGLLGILARMGARIEDVSAETPPAAPEGEPTADLLVRHAPLTATTVAPGEVPSAIDELPLLALLGCFAEGETTVAGAEELRHKESDRIAALVEGLAGLGADIEARPDGFAVRGTGALPGGHLDSRGDHRLAMLGAIAGLASRDGVEVHAAEAAAISYPRFAEDLRSLLG